MNILITQIKFKGGQFMYYQNGNYMQDLNYYNQNPNVGFNPYMPNNYQAPTMNQNPQMPMQQQNLNAMYPAVYRIISPVVSQVLANNNTGYLTEDALNSMVDTVYNMVEGDLNLENRSNSTNASAQTENSNNSNCSRTNATNPSSTNTSATNSSSNRQNSLLRDLIKIILLNSIISRRQNTNSQMMMSNNLQNPNLFM